MICMKKDDCEKNYQTYDDEMSQSFSTLDLSQNNNHCI